MRTPPVTLIIGNGRSGTNMLLDLLDADPDTNCRNEPNVVAGGAINRLFGRADITSRYDFDAEQWRDACETARRNKSVRDRPSYAWKRYTRKDVAARVCSQLFARHRARRALLSRVTPALAGAEFPLPRALVRRLALNDAHVVLKINQPFQLCEHLDRLGAPYRIVHIARNPYDVVRSWSLRWLVHQDRTDVWRALCDRAREYFAQAPDRAVYGRPDQLDLYDLQLLHVVLGDDHLFHAMRGKPHYLHVTFEHATAHRIDCAREVYDFLGLEWTHPTERRIARLKNDLFKKLPDVEPFAHTDFMARTIAGSELRQALGDRPYYRGAS
jgi:hypothetical protein